MLVGPHLTKVKVITKAYKSTSYKGYDYILQRLVCPHLTKVKAITKADKFTFYLGYDYYKGL